MHAKLQKYGWVCPKYKETLRSVEWLIVDAKALFWRYVVVGLAHFQKGTHEKKRVQTTHDSPHHPYTNNVSFPIHK